MTSPSPLTSALAVISAVAMGLLWLLPADLRSAEGDWALLAISVAGALIVVVREMLREAAARRS